ncbi:MAG TPA: helix-turn-helix transcriptional regulator [Abditibacterium sp.]|jgi:HTH-type transcriptional regulator/antitoxin HigA
MLQNEREYQNTKAQLARLEAARREAEAKLELRPDLPEMVRRGHLNGISLLIGDLETQLSEYEQLRDGQVKSLSLDAVLTQLPETLVRARIARGWTQKELALALGTSEQQVQKDEAGAYAKASLEKLSRIAQVLGVSLSGRARLRTPQASGRRPRTRVRAELLQLMESRADHAPLEGDEVPERLVSA